VIRLGIEKYFHKINKILSKMPLKKFNVCLNFIQSFIDFETGFPDLHFCERGKWPTFLTFAPNAE
jgi:hypothetical protein